MIYRRKFIEKPSTGSKIFYLQDYDLKNEVKVAKNLISSEASHNDILMEV